MEQLRATPGKTRDAPGTGSRHGRLLYIDNLRWTMILLVISMHAADTYSPFGNWYFVERPPVTAIDTLFFGAWQMYLQSFFMGLLFFVAGFFVPASYDRKGAAAFVRQRAIRLGVPVLLYMFLIGPVTEYDVAHSWTSTLPTSFAHEWVKHVRDGEFLQENGPLWFCLALLIFCLVYAALRSLGRSAARAVEGGAPPSTGHLVQFALLMAVLSYVVRALDPGSLLNMHLGDFPQYILLFTAGVLSARRDWLPKLDFRLGVRWLSIVVPVGMVGWLVLMIDARRHGVDFSGGWNWQSAAFCLWESFTCIAVSFGLLVIYRRYFDAQGNLARFLSANAFGVYVFHPPILIAIARLMHRLACPPLTKFALLTAASALFSFAICALLLRRLPLLRRIL
jgi:fucose 4-O-acetylase-like acetyltransferase